MSERTRLNVLVAGAGLALVLALGGGQPVMAAPDSGNAPASEPTTCRTGSYYHRTKKACVKKACPRGEVVYNTGKCVAKNCPRGTVRKRSSGACVKVRVFDGTHEERYQLARDAAYDGRYQETITLLTPVSHLRDPRVLNYLGFANRKLGFVDTGLAYYKRALAINPNYSLARSYLGEGYLQIGRVDLARQQLAEISRRCGVNCAEYRLLADQLAKHASEQG